jgi:selenide,water dikinase
MESTVPLTRDLVLVGGGHAHALVLKAWGMRPLLGARLTLVDPAPEAAYSGMLPGFVAGHYPRADLMIDLVRLARFAGARIVLARATGIDRSRKHVLIEGRAALRYDVLSLDIGVTSDMPALPGFAEHAHPAKPLAAFADAWEAHLGRAAEGGPRAAVVIGGGVAGTELAFAMAHRLGPGAVTLLEAAPEPLPGLAPRARRLALAEAKALGLAIRAGERAARVLAAYVETEAGTRIPSAFTAGAAGARPAPWLAETGLALHEGFLAVGPTLQSETDPAIFAAGDCAHLSHAPRPKAGVFAVRAAPVLFESLRAALAGRALRAFRPQHDYLKLISLGARNAIALRSGLSAKGAALWRWKDRIDRRFMARLADLPEMPRPALPPLLAEGARELSDGPPLCGGCAAKVGRGALTEALAALPRATRPDVLRGAGDDAAILAMGEARQAISTDQLRAFTLDPYLLARIAAIHALGDLWSKGAAPQAALAQIVLPRMAPAMEAATLAEILAAASAVFRPEGAEIVGGHTAIGAELGVGFTVTGLVDTPIGQSGAKPGDALILTKPLGTGAILAAEMAYAVPGPIAAKAWESMARPSGAAARLLAPIANAMTDVTGFGLAGHLAGILEASGLSADLSLAGLPVLEGAEALLAQGLRSSLHAANASLALPLDLPPGFRAELLFDPQTAGGLLAAVPAEKAPALLADLGNGAALIGRLAEGPPAIRAR